MRAFDFLSNYSNDPLVRTLAEGIRTPKQNKVHVKGISGGLGAITVSAVSKINHSNAVVILHDKEEASYFFNDLQNLLGEKNILFFPMSYKKPYQYDETENANVLMRSEVLNRWSDHPKNQILVTYPEALVEKVLSKKSLSSNTLVIKKGEQLDLDFLLEFLNTYGFEKTEFVYEAGQYSVRGGIIDVFSFANDLPFRIELFGKEIDSLRSFEAGSQLSVEELDRICLMPDIQTRLTVDERHSLFDFIPDNTCIWIKDIEEAGRVIQKSFDSAAQNFIRIAETSGIKKLLLSPDQLFINSDSFIKKIEAFVCVEFGKRFYHKTAEVFSFSSNSQPSFNKNFDLIVENLFHLQSQGFALFIASDQPRQVDRLQEILEQINPVVSFQHLEIALHEGFVDEQTKILCYTDHQLFERFHRYRVKERYSRAKAITLRELQSLQPGDFVTHIDFGIAKFAGLEKMKPMDVNRNPFAWSFEITTCYISTSMHCIKYPSIQAKKVVRPLSANWVPVNGRPKRTKSGKKFRTSLRNLSPFTQSGKALRDLLIHPMDFYKLNWKHHSFMRIPLIRQKQQKM